MKYAFIINLVSGTGNESRRMLETIQALAEGREDILLRVTREPGDAEVLADILAEEAEKNGEPLTVFFCGGDGTVHEGVNGIMKHPQAVFGVLPTGSGNDFVANFNRSREDFLSPEAQLAGEVLPMDVLHFEERKQDDDPSETSEPAKSGYVANGINIGFDGNTAILAKKLCRMPGIHGSAAYWSAILINLLKKSGENLRVTVDGEVIYEGKLLLCTVSNGRTCGGGIELCPHAAVDDGLADVLLVRDLSRREIMSFLPKVKEGKLLEIENFDEIAIYKQAKEVLIEPVAGPTMRYCVDGEEIHTGPIHVTIRPQGLRFSLPSAQA